MRFYSDERSGTRKTRYVAAQNDASAEGNLAVKTADGAGFMDGTWVYLTKNQALALAAQILLIASGLED